MKAISIRQPWAWLIANGYKDIENRTWRTVARGPTLIHASLGMTLDEYNVACAFIESKERIRHINAILPLPGDLERGGIVGRMDIADCVSSHDSPWFMGPFGFYVRHQEVLPFRPWRGQLQFFEVPDIAPEPVPQTGLF